jgi:hypothetical protein
VDGVRSPKLITADVSQRHPGVQAPDIFQQVSSVGEDV